LEKDYSVQDTTVKTKFDKIEPLIEKMNSMAFAEDSKVLNHSSLFTSDSNLLKAPESVSINIRFPFTPPSIDAMER